jgi:peroxiredoxin Q/BCP
VVLAAVNLAQADSMLAPGDPFPSWRLKDQTGTERSSVQYAGKRYLLWFFPKAMTPGCTVEGRGLRDSYADFERANVSVLGISADEPAQNAAFVSQERFPFPLLSDPELELAIKVGAATGASDARARRISYLVGPDGKVLRVYDKVDPVSHADLVLRDIEQSGAPRRKHDEPRSPN